MNHTLRIALLIVIIFIILGPSLYSLFYSEHLVFGFPLTYLTYNSFSGSSGDAFTYGLIPVNLLIDVVIGLGSIILVVWVAPKCFALLGK
ncbi:hypothetical protein [Parapedobacter koreensis]|uniref:Uncharacterized protein n=1 Tax=Parapedobacter koreensis TaxID=332977 RepID=A0A1H7PSW0_9SPHI|nr:hypothetical protein [Parapedobacter koreensis]SEL38910.1 hypothetical protein SAMN05421740_1055 [Parapedobacter koreensis]